MTEADYLKKCLIEVELKLLWGSSSLWKESDYIKLSQIISDASAISISPHTLKRLYGKLKYNEQYKPQQATKDALSKFLGYFDWDDFVKKNKINRVNETGIIESFKNQKKKKIISAILVLLIIGMIGSMFCYLSNNDKKQDFIFSLKDSIGTVPFTVPIHYNLSKSTLDSIYFDFSFIHPYHGKQISSPQKMGSLLNFTYQIPGYYAVLLKNGSDTLGIKKVLAMSKAWDSYFIPENKLGQFWLDNEIKQASDSIGTLYFSPKKLISSGFDASKVFYITHRLFKEFKIDGDNFEFETRFKNSKALGGITCYDYIIRLICDKNTNHLNLMETGCSQFSSIKFGEKELNGSQENLTNFKIMPGEWTVLKITVKNKKVTVLSNGKRIFKGNYNEPNGSIVGIENVFKGAGMLDYIRIKDLNSGIEFFDDFK